MKGLAGMMKQAQQMQKNMASLQDELANVIMEGSAGGDMVKITMTCKNEVRKVEIKPEASEDLETLEDLLVAAFNDVHNKVQTHVNAEVSKISGGLSLPGM